MEYNIQSAASETNVAGANELATSSADMELVSVEQREKMHSPNDSKSPEAAEHSWSYRAQHSVTGPTEPSGSTQQENHSLCVTNAVTGFIELRMQENDVTWPSEYHQLFACDVLNFLRIDVHDHCLYDLMFNGELVEEVHFGNGYGLLRRSCARCPECNACCTRTTIHSLCSHGSFSHLWRRTQHGNNADEMQDSASDETRFMEYIVPVTGYRDGGGLMTDKRFTDDEIRVELANIAREYNITIPDKWITPA